MSGMTVDTRPLAVFLMGPTASGKTALACALRDRFPLELVSVDSALVYRSMDIGTAKPDSATLARYPHALLDIRDPVQPYSAACFRDDAIAVMRQIGRAGRVPLLVGGTGLYFRALQRGLSPLPPANANVRKHLAAEAARVGWEAMHRKLVHLDPVAARRIAACDQQRLQRALEVVILTGRTLSEQQSTDISFAWRVLKLGLLPSDRARLHASIATRFDGMLESGLLDEVAALRQRGDLNLDLPAMRAVGYRQVWEYLNGHGDRNQMRNRSIFATRQLAKRQMTWLRGERDVILLDAQAACLEQCAADVLQLFLGDS